jgi:L-amino acid N-acyltransferase YncA
VELPDISIRDAALQDAEAIAEIYNQGILDRMATLETELRDAVERRRWLEARGRRHPVVVAEVEGAVVGWGSLNPFNPRRAYDHVADFSVYVERSWRGRGVGSRLLAELIERARRAAYHKLVLAAFPSNRAGVALYERFGFTPVGVYREQGQLDGEWVDVLIMEKLL